MVIDNDLCTSLNDILEHHGIDGQKWGVTHGPPYPLDPNKDYSKKELRAYKREIRKQYRKEVKRRKKYIKKYKKEEEERLREEEAKKKAISSGSVSEVEKYKDKMTNEELEEAMKRIKSIQAFEDLKIKDLETNNTKTQKEIDRIAKANDLRNKKLEEKYGKTSREAKLEKAARISKNIGDIAKNATSVIIAAQNAKKLADSFKTGEKTATKDNVHGLAKEMAKKDAEKVLKNVAETIKSDYSKVTETAAKSKKGTKWNKVKVKNMGVKPDEAEVIIDAVFDEEVKSTPVNSYLPTLKNRYNIIDI